MRGFDVYIKRSDVGIYLRDNPTVTFEFRVYYPATEHQPLYIASLSEDGPEGRIPEWCSSGPCDEPRAALSELNAALLVYLQEEESDVDD